MKDKILELFKKKEKGNTEFLASRKKVGLFEPINFAFIQLHALSLSLSLFFFMFIAYHKALTKYPILVQSLSTGNSRIPPSCSLLIVMFSCFIWYR